MLQQLDWLTTIQSSDALTRQRGRNIIFISIGQIATSVLGIVISNENGMLSFGVASFLVNVLVQCVVIILARYGYVNIASAAEIILLTASIVVIQLFVLNSVTPLIFLIIPIVVAGFTVSPRWIFSISALVFVIIAWIALNPTITEGVPGAKSSTLLIIGTTILSVTLVCMLGAANTARNVHALQATQEQAEQAVRAEAELNRTLEQRVEERTTALNALVAEQQQQAQALHAVLAERERLDVTLREVELPVIPVRHDVLVVPIVGILDTNRAEQLITRVLASVEQAHARAVILDVTGLAVIDTAVAGALMRTADATALLGARTALVGIRPEVAQAIVGLGVQLSNVSTFATLQEGLERV